MSSKAYYDGCITVDKEALTVRVYRYVRYANGQNELLDDRTRQFHTLFDALMFAERLHEHYKQDNVRLVVTEDAEEYDTD